MSPKHLSIALFLGLVLPGLAQEQDPPSPTQQLRTSVQDWIEVMKEIQSEENAWERDEEILRNYREGLRSEIADLRERIEDARKGLSTADESSKKTLKQFDALKAASDLLEERIGGLEQRMMEETRLFPPRMLKDDRVSQLVTNLRESVAASEDGKPSVNSRLGTIVNLLTAAEQFQNGVHLDRETRETADGRELGIEVVYFGLATAYGVDESGQVGFVGRPGAEGWDFVQDDSIAPRVRQLVDVMNGDQDATFTQLPIQVQ